MRSLLLLLIGLACAPALLAAPSAELSEPVGGWRYHGLLDRTGNPQVAYPTPPRAARFEPTDKIPGGLS